MKPTPTGWPRLSSALFYDDANAAIAWLIEAFGFELRIKVDGPDGTVKHSELFYGDAVIMVGQSRPDAAAQFGAAMLSPRSVGGANTQSLMLYVDDAVAHCERARAAGANIIAEPSIHDYGEAHWADRSYGALDPEGHMWWISERVRG